MSSGVCPSPASAIVKHGLLFEPVATRVIFWGNLRSLTGRPRANNTGVRIFLKGRIVEELCHRFSHSPRSPNSGRINARGVAVPHESRINCIYELLNQRGVRTTLLVSDGTPVVFEITEVTPRISVIPVTSFRQ